MDNLLANKRAVQYLASERGEHVYLLHERNMDHVLDSVSTEQKTKAFLRHRCVNLLKPTSYVMHQQFYIQQLYALPALYLCVLYLSENKQRLVPLTA
jgi:hypothetical protein